MTDTNALLHVLEGLRLRRMTATYKVVADAIGLTPPGQIQALAALLEAIQEDDAHLERPQRAALVIQNGKDPIPRPGFFQQLTALGVYQGNDRGAEAAMWHQNEIERLYGLGPLG
ncbi:hypothetical protein [Saccharospirillum alexandrii]|uniref:hypothetical protein n=1 Tax=Saccharospirillum alexandrii TaxID=2448477 RepID=UPI0037359405